MEILKKLLVLNFGLALFAIGIVLTIHSQLGAAPWDVFHLGVTNYVNLTLGQVSQITGFVIIIFSIFLGEVPGIATFLNSYLIGIFIDFLRNYKLIPLGTTLGYQVLMVFLGIYLIGWGSYFYLIVGLGSGPRDSLMVGLIKKTKQPVWKIRLCIESAALLIGYLLGGLVGVGTILVAGFLGFAVQNAFKIMKKDPSDINHRTLIQEYSSLKQIFSKIIKEEKAAGK